MLESLLVYIGTKLVRLGSWLKWAAEKFVQLLKVCLRIFVVSWTWIKTTTPMVVRACIDKFWGCVDFCKRCVYSVFRKLGMLYLRLCGFKIVTGEVVLTAGQHEVRIDTCGEPCHVWVLLANHCGVPVCHGSVDKVGVELGDKFFTLYADISSNHRAVCWTAVLK